MPPLSSDDRRALLTLARTAILDTVLHGRVLSLPPLTGPLAEPGSAFVTLHCRERLRGCVGQTGRSHSLGEVVARCAISAVLHDPRFPAVRADEVAELEIEISVLSEMRPISAEAIEAGTHGVLVIRGEHRGLLLPQVAAERNWPVERFIEETCRKAGLPPDAWRDPETKLLGFAAEIFSERDLREPALSVG